MNFSEIYKSKSGGLAAFAWAALFAAVSCAPGAPEPYGALPSEAQVEWQKMETNMFVHFGPNTFTSAEWETVQKALTCSLRPTLTAASGPLLPRLPA